MAPFGRHRITVSRRSRTATGGGAFAETYSPTGVPERGTVSLASIAGGAREIVQGEREEGRITHVALMRRKADVVRGDRLSGSDIPTLDVLAVLRPSHDHLRVLCEEVQAGG